MPKDKVFVISLGGSVVVPNEINIALVKRFASLIKNELKKNKKFIIVVGGGKTSRKYQKAVSEVSKASNVEKDWIGIESTRLNSLLLKAVFGGISNPTILDRRFKIRGFGKYKIIIACGWKPGWSTDFVAVRIAADFKLDKAINLGKADYVYSEDFEDNPKATKIEKISWKDYLKIIPNRWEPGLNTPIDPVAARLAKKSKMQIVVASGEDINNIKKIFEGKKFKGTVIS